NSHVKGIHVGRACDRDDLTSSMRPELRRVNAVKEPWHIWVLTQFEEVLDHVRVIVTAKVIQVLQVWIIGESRAGVTTPNFMPANVVERFFVSPVLIDCPGKELVERMSVEARTREQVRSAGARLRKYFGLIGRR